MARFWLGIVCSVLVHGATGTLDAEEPLAAATTISLREQQFLAFMQRHGKEYATEGESRSQFSGSTDLWRLCSLVSGAIDCALGLRAASLTLAPFSSVLNSLIESDLPPIREPRSHRFPGAICVDVRLSSAYLLLLACPYELAAKADVLDM